MFALKPRGYGILLSKRGTDRYSNAVHSISEVVLAVPCFVAVDVSAQRTYGMVARLNGSALSGSVIRTFEG